MKNHTTTKKPNSLLSEALNVPSLNYSDVNNSDNGDDHEHNHEKDVRKQTQHPYHDQDKDETNANAIYSNCSNPLSPPSDATSYMMYFHNPKKKNHNIGDNDGEANCKSTIIDEAGRTSLSSSELDHPENLIQSFAVFDTSLSSFDTPRIDNVNQVPMNVRGASHNIKDSISSEGSNTWLTNSHRSTQTTGSFLIGDDVLPRHSDFTVPTSNHQKHLPVFSPPPTLQHSSNQEDPDKSSSDSDGGDSHKIQNTKKQKQSSSTTSKVPPNISHPIPSLRRQNDDDDNNNNSNNSPLRRSILGSSVGKKYRIHHDTPTPKQRLLPSPTVQNHNYSDNPTSFLLQEPNSITPPESPTSLLHHLTAAVRSSKLNNYIDPLLLHPSTTTNHDHWTSPDTEYNPNVTTLQKQPSFPKLLSPLTPSYSHYNGNSGQSTTIHNNQSSSSTTTLQSSSRPSSRMQPRVVPMSYQLQETPDYYEEHGLQEDIFQYNGHPAVLRRQRKHHHQRHHHHHHPAVHETVHAQSLLLGLAFMAVWLPNNIMAPNLTQMADYFAMSNDARDLYLGSYCALAVGVFSLPLSALFGFMADFHSRKYLFLACVLCGAFSAAWTGWSKNFTTLFIARLCSGGCMSGSVPVAFSMLGDLFSTEERNAASSGLTAMMGLGILAGQVYAGMVGPIKGWQYPFYVSAVFQLIMVFVIALWVAEPLRGGKEKALQNVFKAGNKYDRQLTLEGFIHAIHKNASNSILLWQGFFTSLPWGIVFVFLNDYLSQEKGFSVPEATFMVMLFGVGCAIGGIAGGYFGQLFMLRNRSLLPLYMAATTFLGIFPFLALLNWNFPDHHGIKAKLLSIAGGCIASLPSVNVRPCILNVNPPETRGAALTAANLLVTLGRGMGPSCIVVMGTIFRVSRQFSFSVTLAGFWTISAIQLVFLANTLPADQDAMEESLAQYAAGAHGAPVGDEQCNGEYGSLSPIKTETTSLLQPPIPGNVSRTLQEDGESILSIEDYMTAFDGKAAHRSLQFVRMGIRELNEEIQNRHGPCHGCTVAVEDEGDANSNTIDDDDDDDDLGALNDSILEEDIPEEEMERRRNLWLRQQREEHGY